MNFKDWIIDLFKDERRSTSVKPVIAIIGALFLCITMAINSVSHAEFHPNRDLIDAVVLITAIALGGDTMDKFSSFKKKESDDLPKQ